jgi:hypothetical protein
LVSPPVQRLYATSLETMSRTAVHRLVLVLAAATLATGALGGLVVASVPAAAFAGETVEPVEPAPIVPVETTPSPGVVQPPLIVAGVGGLGWDDVSATRTPTLWALLAEGASAAAVTVHTTGQPACPEGGWLSLSAGRAVSGDRFAGSCLGVPPVEPEGEGGHVSNWLRLVLEHEDSIYEPTIGTLGVTLARSGVCATAVGPGSALSLATRDGTVARYRPELTADAFDCPLTFVDLGVTSKIGDLGNGRLDADIALGAVVEAMPAGADLLVTSVSAPLGKPLQMGVMVLAGTDHPASLLSSASTRRAGVVRLLDLPTTLVDMLGIPEPAEFQGSPLVLAGPLGDPASTVESLADITVADVGLRAATNPLLNFAGALAMLLVLVGLIAGRRQLAAGWWRGLEAAFLVLAALPVAAYLVTLLRWWDFPDPGRALWLGLVGIATLLAAGVLLLARRPAWRPVLALSAITSTVLVLDAVTGARLHWASPLGTSPVLGNRYYGFGNTTYAVFAVHTILLAGVLASRYVAAGRRATATLTVVGVGLVAVAVDTWPTWGADIGGGLALVPAFGLLALAVSGARLTATRVLGALVAGVVLVAGVAVLDWLRPPSQRSHAGRFVQQVIDGEAWDVIGRKIDYAVASFDRGIPAWLTLAVLLWGALALARPDRFAPRSLRSAIALWPLFRATLAAILVSAAVGSVVNDWGIRIATVILTAALPVVGLVSLLAADQRRRSERAVARSPIATAAPSTASATTAAAMAPSSATVNEASAKT